MYVVVCGLGRMLWINKDFSNSLNSFVCGTSKFCSGARKSRTWELEFYYVNNPTLDLFCLNGQVWRSVGVFSMETFSVTDILNAIFEEEPSIGTFFLPHLQVNNYEIVVKFFPHQP